jgi:2-polyprenyl-6-methoxyphenol hydroxylase-like FAD-dependent oxidoreductase
MTTPRVAVAGAGLGGLCLAQGLLRAGADVTVYERDASLDGRRQGYRLHVDARAGLALQACLPPESLALFQATCGQASRRLTVMSEKLRVLHEQVTGDPGTDPYAPATLSTSANRLTFREVLASGLDGQIAFGHELIGYEADHGGVRLRLADGRSADADVLVGADGVHSAVRRQLLPDASPADTGARCIYGKTPLRGQAAQPPVVADGFTAVVGGRIGMALGVVRFRQPPWPPSRVTVLGDAIHAMSPARGSGANTALQDAALLSRTLTAARADGTSADGVAGDAAGGAEVVAAIGEYERQMRKYGYAAVAASRQAEAETGARRHRLPFWLYRHLARSRHPIRLGACRPPPRGLRDDGTQGLAVTAADKTLRHPDPGRGTRRLWKHPAHASADHGSHGEPVIVRLGG